MNCNCCGRIRMAMKSATHSVSVVVPCATDNDIENVEDGSESSSSKANRLFLDKYRALDRAGQFEQSFPTFSDASISKEYRKWNQQSVSLFALIIFTIATVSTLLVTRYNLSSLFYGRYENPFTVCSQVSLLPGMASFSLYIVSQFYLLQCRRNPLSSSSSSQHDHDVRLFRKQWCDKCLEYPLEDIISILSTLTIAMVFLGRVFAGSCQDNVTIWEAQRCNPVARCNAFPMDDMITFYLVPVYFTMMSRGVSIRGNILSYAIASASVLYAMMVVDGHLQSYSILWLLVYILVTFELERWIRVSFVRHKLLVDSRQTAIAAAENESKQVVFAAHAAQTAAENAAKILDLNNKAHLAAREQDMLRHIMGNVAHDMKTPLHSIIAELEGVRDAVDEFCKAAAVPGADMSSVLGRLQSTTDNTLDVVGSMTQFLVMSINRSQDYAKLTSNIALKPKLETVSISDVLRFVTKCMAHQNNGRTIVMHPLGTMFLSIITDSHFLKDNLLCLVSNAVKYADSGATIDVRVTLLPELPPQQAMVMVSVEDTGIGISDDNKVVLFKPFQQAQRSAGGTGLGLFALAGRIRALEGTCGVRDRDDGQQGSVFWFTFPYRPDKLNDPMDDLGVPAPTPRTTDASSLLPPLRILLTDDSVSILKVTKRFLEKHGHIVETAENGNQSLERLKARRDDFDLLITDLQMPVMDGFESARRYREWEQQQKKGAKKRLFIVGMSAKADDETKGDVFSVGMDAFVPKPFDYKALVDELRRSPIFAETILRFSII